MADMKKITDKSAGKENCRQGEKPHGDAAIGEYIPAGKRIYDYARKLCGSGEKNRRK